MMRKLAFYAVCLTDIFILFASASCSRKDATDLRKSPSRPNVLIITFDTTRPDHLGPYGCKYAFTPTLDRLAAKSILFRRAFSSVPLTLPSHSTIMTGLYPFYHGVRDNSHFILNQKVHTLAEILKKNGYQTAAMVSAFVLDSHFGLDQGFDTYSDQINPNVNAFSFAVPERKATAVTNDAIQWLNAADKNRPYFLWVHYYDPHAKYNAPESFTRYNGHPYDVEIAYADSELARLLKKVEADSKTNRKTLITFAADHGESLEQHGEPTHAYFAYDSTLHVPLMIKMPDNAQAGKQIDCPVGLVDVMPTILDLVGLPVPGPDQLHGRSLKPLITSAETPPQFTDRPIAFECYETYYSYGWSPIQGIRVGEMKYIDLPKPELYDLSKNSKELPSGNLYYDSPKQVADMKIKYRDLFDGMLSFPPFTESPQSPAPDVVEKLRALGYAGDVVSPTSDPSSRPDVKDKLPVFKQILSAMSAITSGEYNAALHTLTNLMKQEPDNPRIPWMLSSIAANNLISAEEALPIIEDALRHNRIQAKIIPPILINCGRACLVQNENIKAGKYFDDVLKLNIDNPAGYWYQGIVNLKLHQWHKAVIALRRAVDLFGADVSYPQVALGLALLADNQKEEAVLTWRKLLEKNKTPKYLWRVVDECPLDPALAPKVTPLLQQCAADGSLNNRLQIAVALMCSNYHSIMQQYQPALDVLAHIDSIPTDVRGRFLAIQASLHLRLGQLQQAREMAEQAFKIKPDQSEVVATLAAVLEKAGDLKQAVKLLSKYSHDHPDDILACNNYAWMLAKEGSDLLLAIKLAKRAVNRMPASPSANDTLGWIYHLRSDKEMAIQLLSKAGRIDTKNATYAYHLAVAYQAAGKLEKAHDAFVKAVDLATKPYPEWYDDAQKAASQSQNNTTTQQ